MPDGDSNSRRDGDEPLVPQKLLAALKEPTPRRVFVPPAVDEAVLSAAKRHFTKAPARFHLFQRWWLWPAAATACLVVLAIVHFAERPAERREAFAREDLNHDGQVDILDAFQLAREVRDGKPTAGRDINGDGVVDQRDVELIAIQAVKLERRSRL